MDKLDEKKHESLNTDLDDMKSDLEEMKKWADHSRKSQKSTLVNTASSESENKTDNKLKHAVKDKDVKKPTSKPETKSTTEVKASTQSKPKTEKSKTEKSKTEKSNTEKPKTKPQANSQAKPKAQANKNRPVKKTTNKQTTNKSNKPQNKKAQTTTKTSEKKRTLDQKLKDLKNQKLKKSGGQKSDGAKEHNYLLWATIAVIAIPCLILLYIVIGSRENSRSPVTGDRFKNSLDPEITEENLNTLKDSLQFDNADEVEITLKSATLRINIDTKDDLNEEQIKELVVLAYDKVNEKLPIKTYFTNKKNGEETMKMYDLEISAYNILLENDAEASEQSKQIHISRTKNAAAEEPVDDVLSSPKDEQSAEGILNPDTSNPPTKDEQTEQ